MNFKEKYNLQHDTNNNIVTSHKVQVCIYSFCICQVTFIIFHCRLFLVRESRNIPGTFVLSLAHGGKVLHCQIVKVELAELTYL